MKKAGVLFSILFLLLACQKDNEKPESIEQQSPVAQQDTILVKADEQMSESIPDTVSSITPNSAKENSSAEKLTKVGPIEYNTGSSESELWNAYNQAKENISIYKENWDFENLVFSLEKAGQLAVKLNRPDIAAWQYNNIGYYSILEFKKRTEYTSRMQDLKIIPYSKEKEQYIQETKDRLKNEFFLLESARENLYDAMELNSQAPDKEREKIIDSNVRFINSISEYIN